MTLDFGGALALIAGLGGPRQILITYLPLFLASLFTCLFNKDKDYSFFKYVLIILVCSGIGYVINSKILHNYFIFFNYEDVEFTTFDINRLVTLINGFILNYGYQVGGVMSATTIVNAIAAVNVLFSIYAVYYPLKHKDEITSTYYRFSLFVLFAYIVFVLLYAFTDMSYTDRYYLPLTVLYIPLITLFFNEVEMNIFKIKKEHIYILFILLIIAQGTAYMYSYDKFDNNVEKREILKLLEDNDYKNGYATFWNGNVYTELSNGDVEFWVLKYFDSNSVNDFDDLYEWLQLKDHMSNKPTGKVFVLLSSSEYKSTLLKKYLSEDKVIYNSGNYIVFGYDSYEELVA